LFAKEKATPKQFILAQDSVLSYSKKKPKPTMELFDFIQMVLHTKIKISLNLRHLRAIKSRNLYTDRTN
jgi:hypothetical protein